MSGLTTPAPIRQVAIDPDGDYVPGACNIGPWEIRRRRRAAIVALAAAIGLFAILVAIDAPQWTRLALIAPAWGGAISWLQARRHFCVAYAMGGLSNFGSGDATRKVVVDPAQRAQDRRATALLLRDAFLLAIGPVIVAVVLPV